MYHDLAKKELHRAVVNRHWSLANVAMQRSVTHADVLHRLHECMSLHERLSVCSWMQQWPWVLLLSACHGSVWPLLMHNTTNRQPGLEAQWATPAATSSIVGSHPSSTPMIMPHRSSSQNPVNESSWTPLICCALLRSSCVLYPLQLRHLDLNMRAMQEAPCRHQNYVAKVSQSVLKASHVAFILTPWATHSTAASRSQCLPVRQVDGHIAQLRSLPHCFDSLEAVINEVHAGFALLDKWPLRYGPAACPASAVGACDSHSIFEER